MSEIEKIKSQYLDKLDKCTSTDDLNKIKNELGWEPSLQFDEGLSKTIDWYLNNKSWINNVTSGEYQKYYKQQYK